MGAVERAAQLGNAAEDLTSGESRMADPSARRFQEQFASLAVDRIDLLRDVLRNGAEPEERAVAAAVIGYDRFVSRRASPIRQQRSTLCTASRSRENWCWAGSGPQSPLHGKVGADHLLVDGQS